MWDTRREIHIHDGDANFHILNTLSTSKGTRDARRRFRHGLQASKPIVRKRHVARKNSMILVTGLITSNHREMPSSPGNRGDTTDETQRERGMPRRAREEDEVRDVMSGGTRSLMSRREEEEDRHGKQRGDRILNPK